MTWSQRLGSLPAVLVALALVLLPSHGASLVGAAGGDGRLFFLDLRGGRVVSVAPDGSDVRVLASGRTGIPDGVAIDEAHGLVYWTVMGRPRENDGRIERARLDGSDLQTVVPAGGTFTPKQLKIDAVHGKLYWSDREGMRVMRANLDGSNIETLVETGRGDTDRSDAAKWCVGIALDVERGQVYWTQKGGDNGDRGSIRRAAFDMPAGEDAASRSDIEVLFDGLPEPIDLDLDLSNRLIYWTDRGDGPRGNTVSRAPMDPPPGADPRARADQEILMRDLREGIGIALDLAGDRMFVTDLGGTVYSARLDGSDARPILTEQGSLTGITYVLLP